MQKSQLHDTFIFVGNACTALALWRALAANDTLSALIFCVNAGITYANALLLHDRMNRAP